MKGRRSVHPVDSGIIQQIPVRLIQTSAFTIRERHSISLANSVRLHGLLQPVCVRPKKNGKFELIFGAGRLRAFKQLGKKTIPAIVRECDDKQAILLQFAENLHRKDLDSLEEAKAIRFLHEEHHLSVRDIERLLHGTRSRALIEQRLQLAKMPKEIHQLVQAGDLTPHHVELIRRQVPEKFQVTEAKRVAEHHLSVGDTEAYLVSQRPEYMIHEKAAKLSVMAAPTPNAVVEPQQAEKSENSTVLALDPVSVEMPWLRYLSAVTRCPICKKDHSVDFSRTKLSSTKDQLPKIQDEMRRWLETNVAEVTKEN